MQLLKSVVCLMLNVSLDFQKLFCNSCLLFPHQFTFCVLGFHSISENARGLVACFFVKKYQDHCILSNQFSKQKVSFLQTKKTKAFGLSKLSIVQYVRERSWILEILLYSFICDYSANPQIDCITVKNNINQLEKNIWLYSNSLDF